MNLDFIIGTYTINRDGSYDINGSVYLQNKILTELPIRFGKVSGSFNCSNNNLTSLEGGPKEVGGSFYCYSNKLISLEGSPKEVGGNFLCFSNKLTSLEGSPIKIGGDFDCSSNNLYNFKGIGKVEGVIYCNSNPVHEIFKLCKTIEFIGYLNEFRPIRGNTILGKRLQDCLYMCDKEIDVTKLRFKNYTLLE